MEEKTQGKKLLKIVSSCSNIDSEYEFCLNNRPDNFVSGKIATHINEWRNITSDVNILSYVKGYKIEFEDQPHQINIPKQLNFNDEERHIIENEIQKLLSVNVIEKVLDSGTRDEFISNIFIRPKKNGTYRMILNLKLLNCNVEYHHFKMETFKSAVNLVTRDCWFGSIDLTDAYYSCNVDKYNRRFLRFIWEGQKYQYTCLPNGLASAPRIFTKIMKPVFSTLRKKGQANVSYIDDSLVVSRTKAECVDNIHETVQLLDSLGLTVHPEKSVLRPTKCIKFLGFWIDSVEMKITLTNEKAKAIVLLVNKILQKELVVIRKLAQLIGNLVASELGVNYAPLYYKVLEIEKDDALKQNYGNFEAKLKLSDEGRSCIQWWIDNVASSFKLIEIQEPVLILKSDSSMYAWGVLMKQRENVQETLGQK